MWRSRSSPRWENELRNVDGLEKMTAVANDGAGILYLEFPENADIDKAADQVKQYADQAAGSLPDGAEAPEVQNIVVYDALMRIALTGDSPDELRRLARRLENELNALDVAKVNVRGIAKEEIQVRVPRGRLMELNTTARELGAAIAAQNRDASAGRRCQRPFSAAVARAGKKRKSFRPGLAAGGSRRRRRQSGRSSFGRHCRHCPPPRRPAKNAMV